MSIGVYWFEGGVVADPELAFTNNGKPYCSVRLGQSDSHKTEQGEWETTHEVFWPVTLWGVWAETAAQVLRKGTQIVLKGKPVTNQWETQSGEKRSRVEVIGYGFFLRPDLPKNGGSAPPVGGDSPWNESPSAGGFGGNDDPPF